MADARLMGTFVTKVRQREQRRPAELQGAFVNDEQQRLLEIPKGLDGTIGAATSAKADHSRSRCRECLNSFLV
jgi:hypothetical protein